MVSDRDLFLSRVRAFSGQRFVFKREKPKDGMKYTNKQTNYYRGQEWLLGGRGINLGIRLFIRFFRRVVLGFYG